MKRLIELGLTTPDRVAAAFNIKFKDISRNSDVIYGIIEKERSIVPMIKPKDNKYSCTCEDFLYRKLLCKHLVALYLRLTDAEKEMFLNFKDIGISKTSYLSTGCEALDKLLQGGVPRGILLGIFGESKIGKTWLAYQIAASAAKQTGKPALYIDTEEFAFERLKEYFSKRFGDFTVHTTSITDIHKLLEFFGIGIELNLSEGGRIDALIKLQSESFNSPIYQLAKEMEYCVIVLDSMTEVLKRSIPTPPQQNFPARAAVINILYGRFEEIVSGLNATGIIIHHQSRNPMMSQSWGKPYGGPNILYNTKYLLQILPPRKADIEKYGERARRIIRVYWPGLEEEEVVCKLEKDWGYV